MWKQDCGGLSIGGEAIEWEDRGEKGLLERRLGLICKWNGGRDWILRRMEPAIFFPGTKKKAVDVVSRRTKPSRRVTWRYSKLMHSSLFLYLFPCPFLALFHPQGGAIFSHAPRRLISLDETSHWISPTNRIIRANFLSRFPFRFNLKKPVASSSSSSSRTLSFRWRSSFGWSIEWT